MKWLKHTSIFLLLILISSCKPLRVGQLSDQLIHVHGQDGIDSSMYRQLLPYKEDLDKKMDRIISYAGEDLIKQLPSSNIGNMMADVIYDYYKNKGEQVDFALTNQGGIRVSSIAKGNLTVGNAFELMPFDNYIVMLNLPGVVVDSLLRHICNLGGWPVSHVDITMDKNNVPTHILIDGKPLDKNKIYKVATHNYIASGGDDCSFLTRFPMFKSNKFLRDAIIESWESHKQGIVIDDYKRIRYE